MGPDTSHDCWHGPYSSFNRWREELARAAEMPPLTLMEGYFERAGYNDPIAQFSALYPESAKTICDSLPIKWDALRPDILHVLLNHSDCEGEIATQNCAPLADRLSELLPVIRKNDTRKAMPGIKSSGELTERFIKGLRLAAERSQTVKFE